MNPLFVNAFAGDFRLQNVSPCVDTGDNRQTPVWLRADLAGVGRYHNGQVDMGAYENQYLSAMEGHIYVSTSGSDANSGLSWEDSKKTLQAGVDAVLEDGYVFVGSGTYAPVVTSSRLVRILAVSDDPGETVIDGGNIARCATLGIAEGGNILTIPQTNTVLQGFTLQNGWTSADDAQIAAGSGAGVMGGTLINCVIRDSIASLLGLKTHVTIGS